jgi:hypothetical protein
MLPFTSSTRACRVVNAVPFTSAASVDRILAIVQKLIDAGAVDKQFTKKFQSSSCARFCLPVTLLCSLTPVFLCCAAPSSSLSSKGLQKHMQTDESAEAKEAAEEAKKMGVDTDDGVSGRNSCLLVGVRWLTTSRCVNLQLHALIKSRQVGDSLRC